MTTSSSIDATVLIPRDVNSDTKESDINENQLPQYKDETPTQTNDTSSCTPSAIQKPLPSFVRADLCSEIAKRVLRCKLSKFRHLLLPQGIAPEYLDGLFPTLLQLFDPQHVTYNGGIANVPDWKISCYLEVMPGGVPTTNPNTKLLDLFTPLLDACNELFLYWHRQQRACNNNGAAKNDLKCKRLMTFITRYTPAPGEQALLKHVDGAGKVDGSCVVALPIDRWSAPEEENSFIGHGGGLTFWDGPRSNPQTIHYETRSGDIAFIDRAVWHQADPIVKGTRWALVIFYKVLQNDLTDSQ